MLTLMTSFWRCAPLRCAPEAVVARRRSSRSPCSPRAPSCDAASSCPGPRALRVQGSAGHARRGSAARALRGGRGARHRDPRAARAARARSADRGAAHARTAVAARARGAAPTTWSGCAGEAHRIGAGAGAGRAGQAPPAGTAEAWAEHAERVGAEVAASRARSACRRGAVAHRGVAGTPHGGQRRTRGSGMARQRAAA